MNASVVLPNVQIKVVLRKVPENSIKVSVFFLTTYFFLHYLIIYREIFLFLLDLE
jgi:hypothetical protein